jgi:hypothetical protein
LEKCHHLSSSSDVEIGGKWQQKERAEEILPSIEFQRGVCVADPAVVDGSQRKRRGAEKGQPDAYA